LPAFRLGARREGIRHPLRWPGARVRERMPPCRHRARLATGGILRCRWAILGLLDPRCAFRAGQRILCRGTVPWRIAEADRDPGARRAGVPHRRSIPPRKRRPRAMTPDPQTPDWECSILEKVALQAVREQRRARLWGLLVKLL